MPGKRSSRKNVTRFFCPYCEQRLWRRGGEKYHLFYTGALEIQQNVSMPRQSAVMLAAKGVYVDNNVWIEEFTCGQHGKMWLKVCRKEDGRTVTSLATHKDWKRTSRTIHPETPNPSVSEFTYRMSRQTSTKLIYHKE
ncbi:hypothetical protein [Chroogloeocystis siderophila]|jgi:hypothetical protein|uniref:Uncharacterized protein n=1 Tax=Chroogloeocystis siderophila 5.2 s.c.1 TaxID=247279 RepID=A0A1U7HDZ8_9CHRO|nr:hypothetical protein [Chroogloeocystis siderophila]OKH21784.1 hypothetical protein NIES1031_21245 [Chroogloeocystis siderophila 5.2 s.c.1]